MELEESGSQSSDYATKQQSSKPCGAGTKTEISISGTDACESVPPCDLLLLLVPSGSPVTCCWCCSCPWHGCLGHQDVGHLYHVWGHVDCGLCYCWVEARVMDASVMFQDCQVHRCLCCIWGHLSHGICNSRRARIMGT